MTASANNQPHRPGHRWRAAAWGVAAGVLLLPLLAMQVTDEVAWSGTDFLFAGVLVGGVGLLYELALRRASSSHYRAGVAVALAAAFFMAWINAAVGIIGPEDHPANTMFAGVIAVAVIGGCIARFRAAGLAKALLATAAAQVLVAVAALMGGPRAVSENWPWDLLGLTAFFATLWWLSAWFFRKASREAAEAG